MNNVEKNNNMKKISSIICLLSFLILISACADSLERYPTTEITEKEFFNNATDLQTYTNGLYSYLEDPYADYGSDNVSIHNGTNAMDQVVMGNVSSSNLSSNINGWTNWTYLRRINFYMVNKDKAVGNQADLDHFEGIARFFRAMFYYDKVKDFSDVPWYDNPLDNDAEELYKPADPRATVMNNILADLEFAATHIKPEIKTRTRINQYAAMALMARICLFEGTYRKYHSEISLQNDHTRFLEKAVWACEQIMNSGEFALADDYGALFDSYKLDTNSEIILQKAYDKDLGVTNNTHSVLNWQWSLSRSLMESYLMTDGTPFTKQEGYATKTYLEVFENRDPRFAQTFCYPGFKTAPQNKPELPGIKFGGYGQIKFYPKLEEQRGGWGVNYTSLPIYRLGEIYLIYAEAKAELGTLSQTDVDNTINKLRDRVGMPHLSMATANANVDAHLASYYPNVSGANQGVILEIRRERRVELACEGLRGEDLKRWEAGTHFADNNEGIYVPYLGAYDMTGDGEPDLAILASPTETGPIDNLTEEQKANLVIYYLKNSGGTDEGFYLTEGIKGHVGFTAYQKNPRKFEAPKHYYLPIPRQQTILNPQLKQPFGWD